MAISPFAQNTLNTAAQIMWDFDIGCLPVIDKEGALGMLTNRDVCMSAHIRRVPLSRALPAQCLTEGFSCTREADMAAAEK